MKSQTVNFDSLSTINCPSGNMTICGSYSSPPTGGPYNVSFFVNLVGDNEIVSGINEYFTTLTPSTFCLTIPVSVLESSPEGNYEMVISAEFTQINSPYLTFYANDINGTNNSGVDIYYSTSCPVVANDDDVIFEQCLGGSIHIFDNDTFFGNVATTSNVSLSQISTSSFISLNLFSGIATVEPNTPPGTYNLTYQICNPINSTQCDQAIISVIVKPEPVVAVNDFFTVNSCLGGTTVSVLLNDTVCANTLSFPVNVNFVGTIPIAGASINNSGEITIPSNTNVGSYTFTYQVCHFNSPSVCSNNATVTINVVQEPLIAINDNFSTTLISSVAGGSTSTSVLANDTLNGVLATSSNVTTAIVSSSPSIPFLTISSEGIITVPPGVTAGSYTITYSITQIGCASNITYGTVIIVIGNSEVTPDIVPGIRANSIVSLVDTQTSNKIIIVGYFSSYNNSATSGIARLNDNLTLDTTTGFNVSGPITSGYGIKVPSDMKVLKNSANLNKILLVGGFAGYSGSYSNGVGIARLLANGNIDTSFNSGPISGGATRGVSGSNSEIRTLYVYPDDAPLGNGGKILIGGMFKFYNGVAREKIARLNPNGSLDMTFNPNNGTVYKPELGNIAGFSSSPQAIVVQSDGKIVVGGFFRLFNGYPKHGVLRLNNDGSIDNSFNLPYINSGNANPGLDAGHVQKIVLQPNNKIIIGGSFTRYNNQGRNSIARLEINGALDTTFNPGNGFFPYYNVPNGTEPPGMVRSMVFDTNSLGEQKLYVSGDFTKFNGVNCDEVIRLYCNSTTVTNGTKDNSFGLSGGGPNGFVWSMKKQGGKMIIGGQFTTYGISSPALNITRILPTSLSAELRNSVIYYDSEPEIDIFSNNEIIIYPNPTTGIINLSRANTTNELIVEVYTVLGQKVFEKVNLTTENTLDLSHLNKGTYFIKFGDGNQEVTKSIIIR